MAAAHIGQFRTTFGWEYVQPTRERRYDWATYDALITTAAEHGITVFPCVQGEPRWASSAPAGSSALTQYEYPPAGRALPAFGAFLRAAVLRYGRDGAFWGEHPNLPYRPIGRWEIWNEPNLKAFWPPKPNVGAYERLLRAAFRGIKSADPGAEVISAGTPFLSAFGAQTWFGPLLRDGAGRYMNAVAVHYYGPSSATLVQILRTARTDLDAHGGRNDGLWVTETAWAGGPPDIYEPNQEGQRTQAYQLFAAVARVRQALNLQGVFWDTWQDSFIAPPADWYANHLGLTTGSGLPKLALSTVSSWAARLADGGPPQS